MVDGAITDGRAIDTPLFRTALQRRLRVAVFKGNEACPCCGEPVDRFGDHALSCSSSGDRTVRHNSIRDVVFEEAGEAALQPEREKAGLLPERPSEDGLVVNNGARRPADVWLPRGTGGEKEALDFAVTSGLQLGWYRRTAQDPGMLFAHYEDHKRTYRATEQQCRSEGLRFTPVVLEAHGGGWSPTGRKIVDWIARSAAAASNEKMATVALKIAQRMSCALQRENARAVLRRQSQPDSTPPTSAWAGVSGFGIW